MPATGIVIKREILRADARIADDGLRLCLTRTSEPTRQISTGALAILGSCANAAEPHRSQLMNGCSHEITYQALFRGPSLCFPCDERGEVPLDSLSESARENYLYARAVVGVEYAYPLISQSRFAA
jgi:hypothetical protein